MCTIRGAAPHPNKFPPAWRVYLAAGLMSFCLVTPAAAQQSLPLTLKEAEAIALDAEPGQAALTATADAFAEQAVAAGQLPDPTLRLGLANFPLESGGFTTEGMTQGQLGIRQAFPPGKTRSLSTQQFRSMSAEMRQSADGRRRDVLTSVRKAWLNAWYRDRAHSVVTESRPYFADLVTVARSLYSVGKKNRQDVLRAELELSRLDERLIGIEQERARARAALSQWVGDESQRAIAPRLPAWTGLPDDGFLSAQLSEHPALQAAGARIDAREAGVRLAEERYKPGWAVDLGYGYRDGLLPDGSPRSDFVSLSVTVDLPVFRKHRQDRRFAAALSERRAAFESREELLRRLDSQLETELARWRELDRRLDLYEQRILILADDQASAALDAYRSDAGDFADVMRGVIDRLNAQLDVVRLQSERAQSYAVIANLGGLPE